jgi:uncharacterized protein (TIGR02246 family)
MKVRFLTLKLIVGIFAIAIALLTTPILLSYVNSLPVAIAPEIMQPEDIKEIVRRSKEAWVTKDADAIATLFARDGEFIVPGNRYVGREAIKKVAADFFAANLSVAIEIKNIIIEGDRAAVEWLWQERDNATGRLKKADDAIIIDFQAGKIARWREYIDTVTWENR